MNWLSKELRSKIRDVFEPRYKRKLSEEEVEEIANNLFGVVEVILKMKWREEYDNRESPKDIRKKS
jgi:hypothetical protein